MAVPRMCPICRSIMHTGTRDGDHCTKHTSVRLVEATPMDLTKQPRHNNVSEQRSSGRCYE
jgi:hypothetical protein